MARANPVSVSWRPAVKLFGFIDITFKTACSTKLNYKTEKAADKAIAKQAALGRVRYKYQCPTCKGWHLTKREQ
jgi:hypothetical protein